MDKKEGMYDFWKRYQYPTTIVADRYDGVYSHGKWLAFPCDYYSLPEDFDGGDLECGDFWRKYKGPVGKGNTPQEAFESLKICIETGKYSEPDDEDDDW